MNPLVLLTIPWICSSQNKPIHHISESENEFLVALEKVFSNYSDDKKASQ